VLGKSFYVWLYWYRYWHWHDAATCNRKVEHFCVGSGIGTGSAGTRLTNCKKVYLYAGTSTSTESATRNREFDICVGTGIGTDMFALCNYAHIGSGITMQPTACDGGNIEKRLFKIYMAKTL
jgi:hypothetical protein